MSRYDISQASFTLSIKDLKDKQELAHHPTDFNNSVRPFSLLSEKAGYTGPKYDNSDYEDNIMVASGESNVGLSLPTNRLVGAPAMTIVYGAYPKNSLVQYSELIKVKIGPDRSLFDSNQLKALANPQLLDGEPVAAAGATAGSPFFLPGVITGTGNSNSEQYIPTSIGNLPFNINVVDNYKTRIYDTYNVWDIYGKTNPLSTETYLYGYGRNTSSRLLNPGHIFQISEPGSLRVKFAAYATELEFYKVPGTYSNLTGISDVNRVSPDSRWMFMGDFRQANYLLGSGAVPTPDGENTETLKNNVGLFEIRSGIESNAYLNSNGVMGGFTLNIDMQCAADSLAFAGGGFPEIKVLIGGNLTVDESGGILGAQVILSVGKPPQVIFPVRGSGGSRYFKTPRTNPTNKYGDVSGTPNIRYQIVTGKEPLSATSGNKVTVQFEALGDLGVIRVLKEGDAKVTAYIAPQVGVVVGSAGFQETQPDYYTNCYCRIRGNVKILATNIVGAFDISPICYRSWSPSMLMFMHVPFSISSSKVLEDMLANSRFSSKRTSSGSSSPTLVLPYSFPKYSYFFNDGLINAVANGKITDEDLLKDGGIIGSNTRYPDAISDPRGAITAAYSVQTLSDTGFAAVWDGPRDITANIPVTTSSFAINQGPSRVGDTSELRLASNTDGNNPLNDFAHKPLTDRELYTQPQYGGLTSKYIQYNIPCIAMWCHPYQNTQLNFAWPSVDHREWIEMAKTMTGSPWYSNTYRTSNEKNNNRPDPVVAKDIESVNINFKLDGAILVKTTTVVIRNPASDILSMLESQGIASGSKGYATLNIFSDERWITVDGFVMNYDLNETGTGLVLTIKFQDPLSYLLDKLSYPGDHIVDGWQVPDAVRYILLRLGLPIAPSVDNVGKISTVISGGNLSEIKIPRLGRFVATDVGTESIKFSSGEGSLKKNLLKALGMVPAFQYPVFYWSERGVIEYRDALEDANNMHTLAYDQWRDSGHPIFRDSLNISFDSSATTYQTVLQTKDRFRQTDIHVPIGLDKSGSFSGYKSQKVIPLERFITEKQDLQLLKEQMEYQNVFISDSRIEFDYAGSPEYSALGGAGISRTISIPYLRYQRRVYILTNVTYNIEFDSRNYGKTHYQWQLLKPPIMQISGTLFGHK